MQLWVSAKDKGQNMQFEDVEEAFLRSFKDAQKNNVPSWLHAA